MVSNCIDAGAGKGEISVFAVRKAEENALEI
jgi:hypothetical protein